MIDYFTIGLTHALLALAAWRLMLRGDLDNPIARRKRPARPDGIAESGGQTGQGDA
ncbi:hypothetical protein [Caenibius sp. WL]|uniref:hypothetical protein n=1 Tax=Caenibius sp. WL TaxID=2872646 RepID=UPI001C9A1797|nr:hypothetical protein [Caenibius sp. WL]QZP08798.1 hypothetical protein K5X80_03110 [Caenibius sp. WL]